jgi:hypothetical protein
MKRFILIAAAAATLAPAAFASSVGALSPVEESEIRAYAPNADLSNLTSAQISALLAAVHDGDGSGIGRAIYSILN